MINEDFGKCIVCEIYCCNMDCSLNLIEKRGFYIEIFLFNLWKEENNEVYVIMLVFVVVF